MFGSIVVQPTALNRPQRARYRAVYCGLCHALHARFGAAGRACLSYDMTFLALLLAALYGDAPPDAPMQAAACIPVGDARLRCPPHPLRGRACSVLGSSGYAADMNLLLAYYKQLDDWQDEGSRTALARSRKLATHLPGVRERWPRQCAAVAEELSALGGMEARGETNPDLPAHCFGRLLGEVFAPAEDAHAHLLRQVGASLGRFVYLLDAHNDLRADLRRERYNPLTAHPGLDIEPVLALEMDACTRAFEQLPIAQDADILRNVLYAGVWTRYRPQFPREGNRSLAVGEEAQHTHG